jgi:hypothetical protein
MEEFCARTVSKPPEYATSAGTTGAGLFLLALVATGVVIVVGAAGGSAWLLARNAFEPAHSKPNASALRIVCPA